MPYYLNNVIQGLISADSNGDGYSITLKFAKAYPQIRTNSIAYNIYMSNGIGPVFESDFFIQPPAFVYSGSQNSVVITDLVPGEMYHFGIRAFEYDATSFDITTLPQISPGLAMYPQSLLASNISATDLVIPLVDASGFPNENLTVRLGYELINYATVDYVHNDLLVPAGTGAQAAYLVDQGGQFYTPLSTNIGAGTLNSLSIIGADITETWTIRCIYVQLDNVGNPVPTTAKFEAFGSISGNKTDVYGNFPVWTANGVLNNNSVLSFSITETAQFHLGDGFVVKVAGAVPGTGGGRGYNGTIARPHDTDGYDGYLFHNPNVIFWPIEDEDQNVRVSECWNRFDIGHYPFTLVDGYHQITKDILTTNLEYSDQVNTGFPAYDFAGWHRTDPVLLLNGTCVGSYIGGYMFCADGYNGVGQMVRGLNIQQQNLQRQEVLLSTTGEPVCLIKRTWTGITCKCYLPYNENPSARCLSCFGGGFVVSFSQFFDPRRSDGRIMVRFDPAVDDLIPMESGLESDMKPSCWTLAVPTLKDRDIIVRFDESSNEEFRYEVLNVTRNKLLLDQTGVQKFALQRIRKTDIYYQIKVFRDTSMFPVTLQTSITSSLGLSPHQHSVQFTGMPAAGQPQLTGISQGHNHYLYIDQSSGLLTVSTELGHTHSLPII